MKLKLSFEIVKAIQINTKHLQDDQGFISQGQIPIIGYSTPRTVMGYNKALILDSIYEQS
jgi:hypothetical protein